MTGRETSSKWHKQIIVYILFLTNAVKALSSDLQTHVCQAVDRFLYSGQPVAAKGRCPVNKAVPESDAIATVPLRMPGMAPRPNPGPPAASASGPGSYDDLSDTGHHKAATHDPGVSQHGSLNEDIQQDWKQCVNEDGAVNVDVAYALALSVGIGVIGRGDEKLTLSECYAIEPLKERFAEGFRFLAALPQDSAIPDCLLQCLHQGHASLPLMFVPWDESSKPVILWQLPKLLNIKVDVVSEWQDKFKSSVEPLRSG